MPFLELSLTISSGEQPRAENALKDAGALSITLMDADANTPEEAAIFEPGVGESPLWRELALRALFEADTDRRDLMHLMLDALPELAPDRIAFCDVADQDWERAWMERYSPMQFGRRLWIYPWNIAPPDNRIADSVVVRLDPGLAFGTGTHPTTALCLEWLDGLDLAGKTVLDYGCGSGVLAIAALKLGAARAIGIDNDPQALVASYDNAGRNGVSGLLQLFTPEALTDGTRCDMLIANILAGPLGELAPCFADLCKPDAPFALSGILAGQEPELLARYRECGFTALQTSSREDWVRIDGRAATA